MIPSSGLPLFFMSGLNVIQVQRGSENNARFRLVPTLGENA